MSVPFRYSIFAADLTELDRHQGVMIVCHDIDRKPPLIARDCDEGRILIAVGHEGRWRH